MNGNGNYPSNGRHCFIVFCFRFCPSVFFYLCTVIPSVWFLELDLAARRSKFNVTQVLGLIPSPQATVTFDIDDTLPVRKNKSTFFVVDMCHVLSFGFFSFFFLCSLFHGEFQLKCGHKLLNKPFFLFLSLDVGYYLLEKQ